MNDTVVIHSWSDSRANFGREISVEEKLDTPPMGHPIARIHPDTGRRALFLGTHAAFIEGMDDEAGRAFIAALEVHGTQESFIFRHRWRKGDVLMWDNRCLLHCANGNFDAIQYARVLHRTCLRGTPTTPEDAAVLAEQQRWSEQ